MSSKHSRDRHSESHHRDDRDKRHGDSSRSKSDRESRTKDESRRKSRSPSRRSDNKKSFSNRSRDEREDRKQEDGIKKEPTDVSRYSDDLNNGHVRYSNGLNIIIIIYSVLLL